MKLPVIKRWLLPAVVGLAAGGVILLLIFSSVRFGAPGPILKVEAARSGITLVDTRQTSRDADLFALEPLFLPTPYNTSVVDLPPRVRREPGSMDFTYQPKYTISDSAGGVPVGEPISIPEKPIEVLSLGAQPDSVPEVGRVDIYVPDLPPRLAFVEISEARTGRVVLTDAVSPSAAGATGPTDWAPVEFIVGVDRAGLVGSPLVANSQASEEVEGFFRDFLTKQFQLGARLSPGIYAVRVGP